MRRTLLLATLALTTGAACAHKTDAPLWQAAFDLSEPKRAPEAETLLRKAEADGYDVLVRMARSAGDQPALQAAASETFCPFSIGLDSNRRLQAEQGPFWNAGRLAARMLAEDAKLRERVLASPEPFDRRLVLIALMKDSQALLDTLAKLEGESEPRVLKTAEGVLQCAQLLARSNPEALTPLKDAARKLSERTQAQQNRESCDSAEDVTSEMQEGLVKGTWKVSGWGTSNNDLSVYVVTVGRGGREKEALAPACAIALYDAMEQRGMYLPGLIIPVATEPVVPADVRHEAGRRAVRDLERYPEQERNELAAKLMNAGHAITARLTLQEDITFEKIEVLEAAMRQKQPGALEAIERRMLCRGTFGSEGLHLLGYLATPQAAETAWQIASRCIHGVADATAALVRMKDPRALGLLEKAVKNMGFNRDALSRALIEHYTPALGQRLRELDRAGNHEATELLRRLREAGVLKD